MSGPLPFHASIVPDFETRLSELLPPLVERGRRETSRGLLTGAQALVGSVEALAVDTLRSLTRERDHRLPVDGIAESLARDTGARVLRARRPLVAAGPRGPEAFERAFLVALLWDLRRHAAKTAGLGPTRTRWQGGLPIVVGGAAKKSAYLFLGARPAGRHAGEGLAVGYASREREAALDLLLPEPAATGPAAVLALQLRRRI